MERPVIVIAISLTAAALLAAGPAGAQLDVPEPPLFKAVAEGDVQEVRRSLALTLSPRDRCYMGESIAAHASAYGDLEILELLVQAGASLQEEDCRDDSPLYHAAEQGHAKAVRFLLSKKADVKFRTGNGSTPLLAAVTGPLFQRGPKGDARETVRLLLEAGSDPDAENRFEQTPLLLAVRRADARLARLLLDRKADPRRKNGRGVSALDLARQAGLDYMVAVLEKRARAEPTRPGRKLIDAAQAGDLAVVDKLVKEGAPLDALDEGGSTPLIHAAFMGHEAVGVALVRAGADAGARNQSNDTALIYAAARGCAGLLKALLDRGADPLARDHFRGTGLSYAVREGKPETAALLLARGAPPDESDDDGKTLLMEAAVAGDAALVRTLLDGQAAVDAVDKYGRSALMHALKEGKDAVARVLIERGADTVKADKDGATPMRYAAQARLPDIASLLLQRGSRPDPDALLASIANWDVASLKLLLKNGADPDGKTDGKLPLVEAAGAYSDKLALTTLLVEAGAAVDASDDEGNTPLMKAAEWDNEESTATLKYLLARGADPKAKDKKGMTAWTRAMLNGHDAAAAALRSAGAAAAYDTLGWRGSNLDGDEKTAAVVSDQAGWERVWRRMRRDPGGPTIDFKGFVVVLVSLGRIPGPECPSVAFKEPVLAGGVTTVDYDIHPGIVYDAPWTTPYAVKVFKRPKAGKIVVKEPPDLSSSRGRFGPGDGPGFLRE
ncbi:MAG: ankyrin repeat domain-containing protein [Elusimicrobia bacterium]|nr:ankyrin repeat domain-containing protein [Elusimicrobiota bacterium]